MKKFEREAAFCRGVSLLMLLTLAVIVIFGLSRPQRLPPIMILTPLLQKQLTFRDRVVRWIPQAPRWTWAWRLERAVFGPRKPVNLFANIVSFADFPRATNSMSSIGPPIFSSTNGLQVWLLRNNELNRLRKGFEQVPGVEVMSNPRMVTSDGIECSFSVTSSSWIAGSTSRVAVGLYLGCLARVRPNSTDLTTWFTHSETLTNEAVLRDGFHGSTNLITIKTNLAAALRAQIPKGSGVFLFDASSGDSGRKHIGIVLEPH